LNSIIDNGFAVLYLIAHKLVKKSLPGFEQPDYSNGSNYMTAGAPIILMPGEEYKKQFPEDSQNVFVHHMYAPYYFLLKSLYPF